MSTIEFESARFAPYLPESCQANPGVYGFELALWLSQSLMSKGIVTSYPLGEDWGWFIEYSEGGDELMIGCSSTADEGAGAAGGAIAWTVAVSGHRRWRKRGLQPSAASGRLVEAILGILREDGTAPSVHDR